MSPGIFGSEPDAKVAHPIPQSKVKSWTTQGLLTELTVLQPQTLSNKVRGEMPLFRNRFPLVTRTPIVSVKASVDVLLLVAVL